MIEEWPWYDVVEGDDLDQGDILRDCPVLHAIEQGTAGAEPLAELRPVDDIVVTQTCDLAQSKVASVVVCAVWSEADMVLGDPTLRRAAEEACAKAKVPLPGGKDADVDSRVRSIVAQSKKLRGHFDTIIKGNLPAYAMLLDHADRRFPRSVVSFEHVYSVPLRIARRTAAVCSPRLRLRPPYREHLSSSFGRFFARIGLPVDVPRDG